MEFLLSDSELDPEAFNKRGLGLLPGHLGIKIIDIARTHVVGQFDVADSHKAPNGYLHAGSVVTLADTLCGYGTVANLPAGASGFTTVELKSNFFSTLLEGTVTCRAEPVHAGGTTQVWDARVTSEAGKLMALFRCSNLVLRR